MNYDDYIEEITELIEVNINRLNSMNILLKPYYSFSSKNFFELSSDEYEKLNHIIEEIH